MKSKTLLILIILLAVLAYFGLQDVSHQHGDGVVENARPFAGLKENIDRIELKQGDEQLVLKLNAGQWRATQGELNYPADGSKALGLVRSLLEMMLVDKKPGSKNFLEKYALNAEAKPLMLSLYAGERKLTGLSAGMVRKGKSEEGSPFGNYAPDEGQYLKIDGDEAIYLAKEKIDAELHSSFWLQKKLATVQKADVVEIEFHQPHKNYRLKKSVETIVTSTDPSVQPVEKIVWTAEGDLPDGHSLKSAEVETLLGRLSELNVTEPVSSTASGQLSDAARFAVNVKTAGDSAYTLEAREQKGEWLVWVEKRPEEIFKMSQWDIESIFASAGELFDLGQNKITKSAISGISWKQNGQAGISISSQAGEFKLVGDQPQPKLNSSKLDALLGKLESLDLKDYHKHVDRQKFEAQLAITFGDGSLVEMLDLGKFPLRGARKIAFSDRSYAYSIEATAYADLFPKASDMLDIALEPSNTEDIVSINFKDFELSRDGDNWKLLVGGETLSASPTAVRDWIDSRQNIYDSTYVASAPPFASAAQVSWKDKAGRSIELQFSEIANGRVQVRSSQYGGIFDVASEVARSLLKNSDDFKQWLGPLLPTDTPSADAAGKAAGEQ